tara:strand:+ start:42 stop:512 length:471 start_codon:yes stop_codon:yes gene_type:complete
MARPTKYNEQTLVRAEEYLLEFEQEKSDRSTFLLRLAETPSKVGLALYLNIALSTLDKWAVESARDEALSNDDAELSSGKEGFSGIVCDVMSIQHEFLTANGLNGAYNPAVTKLLLSKHGYSEKHVVDNQSSDGSMTPKGFNDFYGKDEVDESEES